MALVIAVGLWRHSDPVEADGAHQVLLSPHFLGNIEPKLEEWGMASVKFKAFWTHVRDHKWPGAVGVVAVTILKSLPDAHQLIFSKQPEQPVHAACLWLHIATQSQ